MGGTGQSLQMTTRDCPPDAGAGCGQYVTLHAVYKVEPGSYILSFVNSFRRSGFGISEVTHFTPRNRYGDGVESRIGTAARTSPIFTVAAGEVVYIGDFSFDTEFAKTETYVQMIYINGFPQVNMVTDYDTYDYRLASVSYDRAAAEAVARDMLEPEPVIELRRLRNEALLAGRIRIADQADGTRQRR